MKVLLINPPFQGLYHRLNFILPPLGMAYLAAVLHQEGHQVTLLDLNVSSELAAADLAPFDLVGISSDTCRYRHALVLARKAKEAGKKVVLGGYHVTFLDEEPLRQGLADFIIRGEGELPLSQLCRALEGKIPLEAVAGLSYMQEGKFCRNPDNPLLEKSLDEFPFPARELLPMERYRRLKLNARPITSLITSRGCPHNCSFCASARFSGRRFRQRSPEAVLAEIEVLYHKYNFRALAFLDDSFTLVPERAMEVCEGIIRRGYDLRWWCFGRTDQILESPALVKLMGQSGCSYVFMGVESAHDEILDAYGKKIKSNSSVEALKVLKREGIETIASFMLGNVGETRSLAKDTIAFAKTLNPGSAQFTLLTPLPGTQLWDKVQDRIVDHNWDNYDCLHPVMQLEHLSPQELSQLLKQAYREFYLRPQRLWAAVLSPWRGRGIKLGDILRMARLQRPQ